MPTLRGRFPFFLALAQLSLARELFRNTDLKLCPTTSVSRRTCKSSFEPPALTCFRVFDRHRLASHVLQNFDLRHRLLVLARSRRLSARYSNRRLSIAQDNDQYLIIHSYIIARRYPQTKAALNNRRQVRLLNFISANSDAAVISRLTRRFIRPTRISSIARFKFETNSVLVEQYEASLFAST